MQSRTATVLLLALAFLLVFPGVALADWTTAKALSDGAVDAAGATLVAAGSEVHVAWHGEGGIYYRRSRDAGETWLKQRRVNGVAEAGVDPKLAVAGSALHLVWAKSTPGRQDVYYRRSLDGGRNWEPVRRLTTDGVEVRSPVAVAAGSEVHLFWSDLARGRSSVFHKRSWDGGDNWSSARRISNRKRDARFSSAAIAGRELHVAWEEQLVDAVQIIYRQSKKGGAGFGRRQRINESSDFHFSPAVVAEGRFVRILWSRGGPSASDIYYRFSGDAGESWAPAGRLTATFGSTRQPAVAAAGGDLHAVWSDSSTGPGQIFHSTRWPRMDDWSSHRRLTDTAGFSGSPAVAVAGRRVHVVWDDPAAGARQIFYRRDDGSFGKPGLSRGRFE